MKCKWLLTLAGALMLCSCATHPLSVPTTVSSVPTNAKPAACAEFGPVYWSDKDTDATITQVKAHNAVFKALCMGPAG